MVTARRTQPRSSKTDRIKAHIEELKRNIKKRYPEARFQVDPVPESRWPGLWVECNAELISDVTDPLEELQEEFFLRENMDVHVIVLNLRNES